jgi:hypothetical protein
MAKNDCACSIGARAAARCHKCGPILHRMRKIKSALFRHWHHVGNKTQFWMERVIMRQSTRQAAGRAVRGEEGK